MLKVASSRSIYNTCEYIMTKIKEDVDTGTPSYLFVPEQFTLESEKILIDHLGKKGILGVDVTSISRMCERILKGRIDVKKNALDESTKRLLLSMVLGNSKDSLGVFKSVFSKEGFVSNLLEFFSELRKNLVTPEDLEGAEQSEAIPKGLTLKLKDITPIYREYIALSEKVAQDSDSLLSKAAEYMESYEKIKNANVYFCFYNTFDKASYSFIRALVKNTANVSFAIVDDEESDEDCFLVSKDTILSLMKIANEERVGFSRATAQQGGENDEKSHLLKNLYNIDYKKYSSKSDIFYVGGFDSKEKEARFVSGKILCLLRDKNITPSDISICLCDFNSYKDILAKELDSLDIPYFLDEAYDVNNSYLPRVIFTLLQAREKHDIKALFSFLKLMEYKGIEQNDIASIETYFNNFSLNLWALKKPFGKNSVRYNFDLVYLNRIRENVFQIHEKITSSIRASGSISDILGDLNDFLEKFGVYENVKKNALSLEGEGNVQGANELIETYNFFIGLMNKKELLFGGEKGSVKDVLLVLHRFFSGAKIKVIPNVIERVDIGDVKRSRVFSKKHIFFLGANQGFLPEAFSDTDVLTGNEKLFLKEAGVNISSIMDYKMRQMDYLVYTALTCAKEKVFLTYQTRNSSGESMYPSYLVEKISEMFSLSESKESEFSFLIGDKTQAFDECAKFLSGVKYGMLSNETEAAKMSCAVFEVLNEDEEFIPLTSRLKDSVDCVRDSSLENLRYENKEDKLITDISRLEKYSRCPFMYFMDYVLKIRPTPTGKVSSDDIGSVLHEVLKLYTKDIIAGKVNVKKIEQQDIYPMCLSLGERVISSYMGGRIENAQTYKYFREKIATLASEAVVKIVSQLKLSDFKVDKAEERFGKDSSIPYIVLAGENNKKYYIGGVIDRIDKLRTSQGSYIKIIDYKTNAKEIDLAKIKYGLSLQLPVYIEAASKLEGGIPAGVLYFEMDAPFEEESSEEVIKGAKEHIRKSLGVNALLINEPVVTDDIAKLFCDSKGNIDKDIQISTPEEFKRIIDTTKKNIIKVCEGIDEMIMPVSPSYYGGSSACQYCKHKKTCRFDDRGTHDTYRVYKNKTAKEKKEMFKEENK